MVKGIPLCVGYWRIQEVPESAQQQNCIFCCSCDLQYWQRSRHWWAFALDTVLPPTPQHPPPLCCAPAGLWSLNRLTMINLETTTSYAIGLVSVGLGTTLWISLIFFPLLQVAILCTCMCTSVNLCGLPTGCPRHCCMSGAAELRPLHQDTPLPLH